MAAGLMVLWGLAAAQAAAQPAPRVEDERSALTVRATRLAEPLTLDGRLDEPIYTAVAPAGDFIQQEPQEGQPATERSEVWVFFDDDHVYVSARLWKSPDEIIANEMRRDEGGIISRNDNIGVLLDTFHDGRSGIYLNTNPLGALRDALLTDENRNGNLDYDLVWDVRSARFDGGWATEIAVPFKSLRYPSRREQTWGFLVQRIDRRRNEVSYLVPIPASYGNAGIWKVSSAATLVGIEAPVEGGRFEATPYLLSSASSGPAGTSTSLGGEIGGDARVRLAKSVDLDLTYNTDFAQVEADAQQVNTTRFSLFYPEKRGFFLETQSIFNTGFGFGPGNARPGSDSAIPILFFSRRIGLSDSGEPVPILGGARLTGRAGAYTFGVLDIATRDGSQLGADGANYAVARVRRDLFGRSSVGALVSSRSLLDGGASHDTAGLDLSLRLLQDFEANAYYAATRTPGESGDERSYLGQLRYAGDRYGAEIARLKVGDAFNPAIGFVTRRDTERTFVYGRFSPRLQGRSVRKLTWEASLDRFTSTDGVPQTRLATGTFRSQWHNGGEVHATYLHTADRPRQPFTVAGAAIAPGDYAFGELRLSHVLNPARALVGTATVARGGYYGGRKTEVGYNGRLAVTPRLVLEPIVTAMWLDLPLRQVTARVISTRGTLSLTPRAMATALVQYNSATHTLSTNVRVRWEYRPGSDVYAVYRDGRDLAAVHDAALLGRSFTVKVTRLLRL